MNPFYARKKLAFLLVLIVFAWLVSPGSLMAEREFEDTIEKTFKVKPGGQLTLRADFGSVAIDSWSRDEIRVYVTKKAKRYSKEEAEELFKQYQVNFRELRNGLEITGEFLDHFRNRRLQVHFEIQVPEEFNLDVETSGGSISVNDLTGDIDLNTSGGSIKLGNIGGDVDAHTSGGSITLDDANGEVNLRTSGGSINIGETTGRVDAKTSGGSINMNGSGGDVSAHTSGGSLRLKNIKGNIDASTSGGSIHAEFAEQIDKNCQLKTSGGGITVYLKPDVSIDIDASTSGGRVYCELPIKAESLKKKNKLRGQINDGGPLLRLRTSGGNIRIKRL